MDTTVKPLLYLEDFYPGQRFTSGSITVTEEMIHAYARDYDPQPFHLDDRAAKDSLFRGLAASGWHTASLTMGLVVRSPLKVANGLIGMGIDSIRWPAATRPGDILHVDIEVLEVTPSRSRPGFGVVKLRWRTVNQEGTLVQEAVPNCWVKAREKER
ncbi:MAG: MaoC family dehydratase [Candidatus Competibacteraceae bacterium]|nr:MaoC family dehydratase [Candidatus Competibacteraceae bacterium]